MVGGLTAIEQRTHFSFWCMLASPLILGNDPRRMSASTLRILTAPELLAVSQDPGARQARRGRGDRVGNSSFTQTPGGGMKAPP